MKKVVINLEDITDTEEYFSIRPKRFVSLFIYILFVIFLICIIIGTVLKIDDTVFSVGEIRPNDSIGTIASTNSGRVKNIYYKNGQSVKKGDKLLELDDEELQLRLNTLNSKKNEELIQLRNIEKFIDGIEKSNNPFNQSDKEQYNNYIKFEDYLLRLKKSKITSEQERQENELNLNYYNQQLQFINDKLNNYTLLRKAIVEDDDSCLDGNIECQLLYKQYLSSVRKIDNEYDEKINNYDVDISIQSNKNNKEYYSKLIDDYNTLIKSIVNNKSEFNERASSTVKNLFDEYILTYESYNNTDSENNDAKIYKNKKLAEYRSKILEFEEQITELKYESKELKKKAKNIDIIEESYNNSLNNVYYEKVEELDNIIKQLNDKIVDFDIKKNNSELIKRMYDNNVDDTGQHLMVKEIMINEMNSYLSLKESLEKSLYETENEINNVKNEIDSTVIKAPIFGAINENYNINVGDVIESGFVIATIVPQLSDEYKVVTYIKNSDIGKINIGDIVKFEILALPANDYGLGSGKVKYISKDVLNNDIHTGNYYVECSIEQTKLSTQNGKEKRILIGMDTNCRIISQQKSVARYLLDKFLSN